MYNTLTQILKRMEELLSLEAARREHILVRFLDILFCTIRQYVIVFFFSFGMPFFREFSMLVRMRMEIQNKNQKHSVKLQRILNDSSKCDDSAEPLLMKNFDRCRTGRRSVFSSSNCSFCFVFVFSLSFSC